MNIYIPKWIIAAFVGAAPMLGMVFFILFSCTLLGLVQRCKINLSRSYANRRRQTINQRSSLENEDDDSYNNNNNGVLFKSPSSIVIVSPFDDIPMKDIDAESSSKAYSECKDDNPSDSPPIFRRNRSVDLSHTDSDYDNGSSSIFDDNDYQQDRISLVETSSQRKSNKKQVKSPDTIINI